MKHATPLFPLHTADGEEYVFINQHEWECVTVNGKHIILRKRKKDDDSCELNPF